MYSTVTFEGNLAADVEVKENKAGGVYVDAVTVTGASAPTPWHRGPSGRR